MWPLIKHFITMYSKQDAEMYSKENQPKKIMALRYTLIDLDIIHN